MKKVLKTLALTGMVLGLAAAAQAANQAQVTLTSPAIVKSGCERVGSVTLQFDGGTVLTEGQWMYMDLPQGTSICNTIDYMIGSGFVVNALVNTVTYPSLLLPAAERSYGVDLAGAAAAIPVMAAGASSGPLTNVITIGTGAATVNGGGGILMRVYAPANGQRVWVYIYGTTAGAANDTLTVNVNDSLRVSLLDGQAYNGTVIMNKVTPTVPADAIYGNSALDSIGFNGAAALGVVPFADNTLCVNAEQMSGSLMFTSFNSLNNFMTFTGDSQIAHVASANPITLNHCKGATSGNILIGGQNACTFDYETPAGFCPVNAANTFAGNRLLLQGGTTFGAPGDLYDMTITSDTAGVYFGAAPTLAGFTPAQTTQCTGAGTAVAAAFVATNESGTLGAAYAGTSCSVAAANRVRNVSTGGVGAIAGIDTYDKIWVNLPAMNYDTTVIGNGIESKVTISLSKYPCGVIFTQQTTLGTFVTTCPVAAAGTVLLYPFMPPMDGSIPGWWGGFLVVNDGTAAGTCTLAFQEEDNDKATYTTPSIAAGGQWNAGALATLLTQVTPDAANAGTFGDSNVAITATCTFNLGGGFAFTGNGNEGTGYTAYVQAGGAWQ